MVGIEGPFDPSLLIRRLHLQSCGIARTSGTYIRGEHIWNPRTRETARMRSKPHGDRPNELRSGTGFATARLPWRGGILFLAGIPEIEGYMVDSRGTATYTPGFARYLAA